MKLYTTNQTAEMLAISVTKLRGLVKNRELSIVTIGSARRFSDETISAYIARHTEGRRDATYHTEAVCSHCRRIMILERIGGLCGACAAHKRKYGALDGWMPRTARVRNES